MGLLADLRILYQLTLKPVRGADHAARLESFYAGQASQYDAFRKRLLHGRDELFRRLTPPEGGVWVDLGGGTGANLENLGDSLGRLAKAYIVDLSPSLLAVARQRAAERGWKNVEVVEGDAGAFRPAEGRADVVTCSYSLTMMPDWFAAIDNARAMLAEGGRIGVVDYYVARKHPGELRRHPWRTRSFWPIWFGFDNVFPSPDHLPYLRRRFQTELLEERRSRVPYLPLARSPYYLFVGVKPAE